MLEDLNRIEWSVLDTNDGDASAVPDYIRALTSTDAEEWADARDMLEMALICDQCAVTSAAAEVIPFLVEIASSPACPSRVEALKLLGYLVEVAVPQATRRYEANWHKPKRPEGEALVEAAYNRHAQIGVGTIQAVHAHYLLLFRLFDDQMPAVRLFAGWAAARCVDLEIDTLMAEAAGAFRRDLLSVVKTAYPTETNEPVRAGLIYVVDVLAEASAAGVLDIETLCPSPESITEQIAKAACLAKHAETLSTADVQPILNACANVDAAAEMFSLDGGDAFPWFDGKLRNSLTNYLVTAAGKVGDPVLPAALLLLKTYDNGIIPKSLLGLIFPGLELPDVPFSELSSHQQKALDIIFDQLGVWIDDITYMHLEDHLTGHARTFLKEMPADRKSMAAYIGHRDHRASPIEWLVAGAYPSIKSAADLDRPECVNQVTALSLRGYGGDEVMSIVGRFSRLSMLHLDDFDQFGGIRRAACAAPPP